MNESTMDVGFHWTPEEAVAVLDYLDRLRDQVWEYYAEDIIILRQQEDEPDFIGEYQHELDI